MTWLGLPMLRALSEGPRLTSELARAVGITTDHAGRVCRCLRARGVLRTGGGVHELTKAGRDAVARGEEITCGPQRGTVRREGSLRARAWRAMRIKERFGLDDLLTLLCDGDERAPANNLRSYLHALEAAGYLARLRRPDADGGPRWLLILNSGPKAPAWNKQTRTLTDPNTGAVILILARGGRDA